MRIFLGSTVRIPLLLVTTNDSFLANITSYYTFLDGGGASGAFPLLRADLRRSNARATPIGIAPLQRGFGDGVSDHCCTSTGSGSLRLSLDMCASVERGDRPPVNTMLAGPLPLPLAFHRPSRLLTDREALCRAAAGAQAGPPERGGAPSRLPTCIS